MTGLKGLRTLYVLKQVIGKFVNGGGSSSRVRPSLTTYISN